MLNVSFSLFFSTKAITTFMSLTKYDKTCEQDVKTDLKLTLEERKRRESQNQSQNKSLSQQVEIKK